MHETLLASDQWKWGDDMFFHFRPTFIVHNERQEVKVKMTEESNEKKKLIEELGLNYEEV